MENTTDHEQHAAWNKGVIVGQKSPFKLKEIWAFGSAFNFNTECVNSPCSTWDSTANCGPVTW